MLAARHVKTWADKLSAGLNTLHVIEPKESAYSPNPNDKFTYNDLSNLVVKRTTDLKYFSDHYFGENVARQMV